MFKKLLSLAVAIILVLSLCGCSDDPDLSEFLKKNGKNPSFFDTESFDNSDIIFDDDHNDDGGFDVTLCGTCHGARHCLYCVGNGDCMYCDYTGQVDCYNCTNGRCLSCGGSGKQYKYVAGQFGQYNCDACYGSGVCTLCRGAAKTPCQHCGGTNRCGNCHGLGTCPTCGGSGYAR